MNAKRAFSLIELLVVCAIIGMLAGLLLPVLNSAKGKARRMTCLNNLRQVNLATRLYAEDNQDAVILSAGPVGTPTDFQLYKKYVKKLRGLQG